MMNDHQTALVSLLLGSFPNFQSGDADAALAAYEIVMSEVDDRDLQPGVMILLNGEYSGHDGRFAPTAPQFATAIRMARDKRLDSEVRVRPKALPEPELEISPEQRAKGKAILDQLAADLGAKMRTDEAEQDRRRNERVGRVNARFMPDMSQDAMSRRLGIGSTGYTTGDPDAEGDMGNSQDRGAA